MIIRVIRQLLKQPILTIRVRQKRVLTAYTDDKSQTRDRSLYRQPILTISVRHETEAGTDGQY